jgi:hypothetical protein
MMVLVPVPVPVPVPALAVMVRRRTHQRQCLQKGRPSSPAFLPTWMRTVTNLTLTMLTVIHHLLRLVLMVKIRKSQWLTVKATQLGLT